MKTKLSSFYFAPPTDRQVAETAMVMALVAMGCAWKFTWPLGFGVAAVVLLSGMLIRPLWMPIAQIWIGVGMGIAGWVSRVLLTALFFALVVPVGAIRRLLGKDAIRKSMKKGAAAWIVSEKTFTPEDFHHPF